MRILVLTHEFPPIGGGGGQAAEDIARVLARRGHEVRVLTAHLRGLPRRECRQQVEVLRVSSGRHSTYKAGFATMAGYLLAGAARGLPLLRQWRPELIHVHFAVPAGVLAWFLSRLTGIPYVLTAHLGDVPGGVPDKTGRWFRFVYPFTPAIWRRATRVVAVSTFTRDLALRHYPVAIQVVPNGVDLTALYPAPASREATPRIVFAGRFVTQKNPLQVVRSLAALRDLPWNCTMLGDGPLRPAVEQEIAAQGLSERITLTGWVTPQEVRAHFERSAILFMPSRSEGLPVVGVQALAMGLAIVASRVGGFVDVVEPGRNGALHDPDDAAGMLQSLRALLADTTALAQAQACSREIAQRFDLEAVASSYETIFAEVVAR